jgi:hypothetical protein
VVDSDDLATHVVLDFVDAAAVHHYAVDRALFRARFPDAPDLDELIVRAALTRAHREAGHPHAPPGDMSLSPDTAPWIGDFTAEFNKSQSCGNAGVGADLRSANPEMEAIVESGVEIQRVAGRRAAASVLQSANVPPSVIRRILSNSTQRRQCTSQERNAGEGNGS